MRSTRASEGRGNKWVIIGSAVIVVLVVVVLAAFFTGVFGSDSTDGNGNGGSASGATPEATIPVATDVPEPTAEPTAVPPKAKLLPEADFGEILSEGWVDLVLPAGETSETWYTLQVDTETQANTFFFATYNSDSDITSTVQVDDYAKSLIPETAEITLFYGNNVQRNLFFDGTDGTVSLTQGHSQPVGPSIFSSDLRVAMVTYGVEMQDEAGTTNSLMNLDLTGLSLGDDFTVKQPAPRVVPLLLREVGELVDQIESKRES